ncbi:MAG: DNA polymerase I [Erysipelotrichales bacterium]|nr:DNA polymerase I [Erysipelotrichales bacterium]
MARLLLIDGNSLVFRAYYATLHGNRMTTSTGIPTGALYGFIHMIKKAVSQFDPEEILVAFDTSKPTFRHNMFDAYKGTRKKADEDLVVQFPIVREFLDAVNITRFEIEGYEADDIIGTFVEHRKEDDIAVLTGDKDILQLIRPYATVYMMKKGISDLLRVDKEELKNTYGLNDPSEIIELKGLMGDPSDNIPGVRKVGEKTALAMIENYGTVENVLAHTEDFKGKMKENLILDHDIALLSKKLATIYTDVPVDVHGYDLTFKKDPIAEYRFYQKYELRSLMREMGDISSYLNNDAPKEDAKKETARLRKLLEEFSPADFQGPSVIFQVFSAADHAKGELRGYAIANEENSYFLPAESVNGEFYSWMNGDTPKFVYDLKEFCHLFKNAGKNPDVKADDLMIASFLVKDTMTTYEDRLLQYDGKITLNAEDVYGKPNKPKMVDPDEELRYACENAEFLYGIRNTVFQSLKDLEIESLYKDVELPLAKILFSMEDEGIRIDTAMLDKIAEETYEKTEALSKAIYEIAGEEFNLNSPKQLAEILFDKLGLYGGKKRSTAADVLEKLRRKHPVIEKILEYRKYQKFYSTYAEGLKKYIREDGKIHTQYNQCLVSTGRLSSSDPNLQNITIRDEESRVIRKAFIPEKGCVLMSADYSQVELRILAHMANEPVLIDTFRKNIDVHTRTAMDIFGIPEDAVTPDLRRKGKTVNFGIVYGISDFGLADRLGIDRYEAQSYIDGYFRSYPNVKKFLDDTVKYCEEHGYVKTLLNRRREIPEIKAKEYMRREFGKRAAMNAPIQGTAADLIKLAMIRVDERVRKENLRSRMIMQVHDELIFNVPDEEIEIMRHLIREEMEHAMELKVPLEAVAVYGETWYEAK